MAVRVVLAILSVFFLATTQVAKADPDFVAIMDMDMMILPGTADHLQTTIDSAAAQGAKILIVTINTPGGMLDTSQDMIQMIFKSPIPVVIYVGPTAGATATSAGVFITLAGHIAAMAPGTSMGAAHPVAGDGKDIEGDMRKKAENMTVAMVKGIAEQRGRNVAWAEKSIRESNSITETEALKMGVVDIVAPNIDELLKQIKGKEVKIGDKKIVLEDYTKLPRREFEISLKDKIVNGFANPNIAALLWLGATTGLSLELYNPGAILPGVVGVICLILALAVSQIIPIQQGAVALLVVGGLLIGAEFYIPSGILGVGGVIAMVIGALTLVDTGAAPGLGVSWQVVAPIAAVLGGFMLIAVRGVVSTYKAKATTGIEGLIGQEGRALTTMANDGKISVNGEIWDAVASGGIIQKDDKIEIVAVKDGLVVEVKKVS